MTPSRYCHVVLAVRTFLWWSTDEWAVAGVWFPGIATAALVLFAALQIRSAVALHRANIEHQRQLLREETRPYVVANLEHRSVLAILALANIGKTPAFDVEVRLDKRFESVAIRDAEWQDSMLFTSAVAMMAPSYKMRFALDSLAQRKDSDLEGTVTGTISYRDSTGHKYTDERFTIDLVAPGRALKHDLGMHDLVDEIRKLNRTSADWGKGGRGLRVNTLDEDRAIARENRPMLISRSLEARRAGGWRAFLTVWLDEWRRRFGLHEF